MISNPNASDSSTGLLSRGTPQIEPDDPDPKPTTVGAIRIRHSLPPANYDKVVEDTFHYIDTKIVNVDAKIFEGRGRKKKLNHYRSLREYVSSPMIKARLREAVKLHELQELNERMHDMVEVPIREASSSFELGLYPDEMARGISSDNRSFFPYENVVLPSTNSPQSKQMLFVDYLDMHRKSFEAATRNPLGKRIVRIIPQFVLGRSLLVTVNKSAIYQELFDEYWKLNKMKLRIKKIFRELLIYGELFLRYFRQHNGLAVRSIDPSTIWDIITNPDDIEDVYYYHQQYVISNYTSPVPQLYYGNYAKIPPATLIIRQIPPEDIDHFKINDTSSEKRGRSELFAILGYLQRFRQFVDDRILLNKMRSMFAVDVAVEGQQRDVDNAEQQFMTPPNTGSVLIHNKNVDVNFKSAEASDSANAEADANLFLKIIAVGAGVSQSFLGVGTSEGTRAGALIQTEPDVKNFEDYQELVQAIVESSAERVFRDAQQRFGVKPPPDDMIVGATFPSIAQEDRSSKLKDLGFAESMSWFTKRRVANIAADEFKQTDYDYDDEQKDILEEEQGFPLITSSLQQVPKIQDMGAEGAVESGDPPTGEDDALTNPGGQLGSVKPSDITRALPSTGTNLRQGGLDRDDEKKRVMLRSSTTSPASRRGWASAARLASIEARRQKAEQKRITESNADGKDKKD